MTKRINSGSRVLSIFLVLCLMVSIMPMLSVPVQAEYHTDNAPAASADMLKTYKNSYAVSPHGGVLRIIDGDLYVWGSNRGLGLGLDKYGVDENNKKDTDANTIITAPVKHDFTGFGNDAGDPLVKVISGYNSSAAALTENGNVYTWGSEIHAYLFRHSGGITDTSGNGGRVPMAWDTTNITALKDKDGNPRKIVDIEFNSLAVYATDSAGDSWVAGCTSTLYATPFLIEGLTPETNRVFRPVAESFVNKLQDSYNAESGTVEDATQQVGGANRRTVTKLVPTFYGGSVFIYTNDGGFYAMGMNNGGHTLIPDDADGSYGDSQSMPLNVLTDDRYNQYGKILVDNNVDINTMYTSGYNTSFIDAKGNVWMVGSNKASLYPSVENHRMPTKVYDGEINGSKAVKVFATGNVATFLTDDNSVYAIGKNENYFITDQPTEGTNTIPAYVYKYTQVFEELSKTDTITGVYPTDIGVMVVTESGDQYWTGSNARGTMGNGTTESPVVGSYTEAVQSNIAPVMPSSDNNIIFEIEDKDGNTYVAANDTANGNHIVRNRGTDKATVMDGSTEDKTMSIKAGEIFKLNVYFEDMARLKSWVVPIRFNPTFIEVVNGNGVPYAENTVVTPGAVGAGVGITQGFTDRAWSGGILIGEAGASGTWPKICNTDGWVSVAGYTNDAKASISGEQHMFSITFQATEEYIPDPYEPESLFDIADDQNIYKYISELKCSDGFDEGGIQNQDFGPGWVVSHEDSDDNVGNFGFNYVPSKDYYFPIFSTTEEPLVSIGLKMYQSDGTTEVRKETKGSYSGYAIDFRNTSEIYTIKVEPNPTDASFPQVDWTTTLVSPSSGVTMLSDYLTIIEEQDTYVKVKIPDNFSMEETGVVHFFAESHELATNNKKATAEIDLIIMSFTAPGALEINAPNIVDGEVIYTATDDNNENKTFTVDFPGEATGFSNTAVIWKVLDKDGNVITDSTANAALTLGTPIPASTIKNYNEEGYTPPQVSVTPVHTTHGSDYVVLRVESLYDPNVFDEIIIKNHFKALDLNFKQDPLRLPFNTSRDLMSLLQITPANDYYEVDLVWEYHPADETGVNRYLNAGNSSIITSGSVATPKDNGDDVFERIYVYDTISEKGAWLDVAVIDLQSPIMPEQIEVTNVLGLYGDIIEVKDGLMPGDIITFYKKYDSEKDAEGKNWRQFGPLDLEQTPYFKFTVHEFLEQGGGEIAMTVTRKVDPDDEESVAVENHRVPVAYDPEPSKVYGYVRLAGKNDNSARNANISVQLTGISTPDIIFTDESGYFEFDTYIQPGTYTLAVYQDNYLKRIIKPDTQVGYEGLVIPTDDEFAISTENAPIVLYPGDIDADGAINSTDVNYYVRNWVGQTNPLLEKFANYDFYDDNIPVINLNDLDMVTRRYGWVRENYAKWYVPAQ